MLVSSTALTPSDSATGINDKDRIATMHPITKQKIVFGCMLKEMIFALFADCHTMLLYEPFSFSKYS